MNLGEPASRWHFINLGFVAMPNNEHWHFASRDMFDLTPLSIQVGIHDLKLLSVGIGQRVTSWKLSGPFFLRSIALERVSICALMQIFVERSLTVTLATCNVKTRLLLTHILGPHSTQS